MKDFIRTHRALSGGPREVISPRLITNGDDALKRLAKTMQEMMAQMAG